MDLERGVAAVAADQAARPGRHPRARSARRRDGRAGAVDEHAARRSPPLVAARRVDFHLKGNALSRWKYRQVDCFICASEAIRRCSSPTACPPRARSRCTRGSISGTSRPRRPRICTPSCGCPITRPIVGNVAALVPHKGQRHLIEAAALVVQRVPDARFVIAGEGELRPALERQIKDHHLEKHVFLAGFRPDVLSVHKAFDIFVMSSVTEGLGTSLLDAMACGKPIVATTAGGMPEVVADGETGLLVPPRDHEAMADAIVGLLTDERLRRAHGPGRPRARPRALQRRADGAGHAARVPARGDARACARREWRSQLQLRAWRFDAPLTLDRQTRLAAGVRRAGSRRR